MPFDPNFICAEWALPFWDPGQCEVIPNSKGGYTVVCMEVQTSIYSGTKEECVAFLAGYGVKQVSEVSSYVDEP